MTTSRIGTVLDGRYEIQEELASGGMGVVYRGERVKLGRKVAIKFLHAWMANDTSFIKRFEIEAKAMAKLQHPNCTPVIDFGVDADEPYVVMDLVSGESLRSLLESDERLPPALAIEITRQVLSGLEHAHRQGITHRDIKPDNLMVDTAIDGDDSGESAVHARILDFGLAKMREGSAGLTAGFVVGTPNYMAPEQSLMRPVDPRTDVYSVGVVLFEMLTGRRPFAADEVVDILRLHREAPPPRLADAFPEAGFSAQLEAVVAQALAKEPDARFQTAAAFSAALCAAPEAAPSRASTATQSGPAPVPASLDSTRALTPAPVATRAPTPAPVAPRAPTPAPVAPRAPTPAPVQPSDPRLVPPQRSAVNPMTAVQPPPPAAVVPGRSRRLGLVAGAVAVVGLIAILAVAGGDDSSEGAAPSAGPAPTGRATDARERVADDPGPTTAVDDPEEAPEETPKDPAAAETPPEFARLRDRIRAGKTRGATKKLEKMTRKYADNAEIPYVLGQLYFRKLWVDDGIDAFRKAIARDPGYRDNEVLIKSAIYGLASEKKHRAVRRFLLRDIGKPAIPHLADAAANSKNSRVRERAERVRRELE